jgi:hypothetical protein
MWLRPITHFIVAAETETKSRLTNAAAAVLYGHQVGDLQRFPAVNRLTGSCRWCQAHGHQDGALSELGSTGSSGRWDDTLQAVGNALPTIRNTLPKQDAIHGLIVQRAALICIEVSAHLAAILKKVVRRWQSESRTAGAAVTWVAAATAAMAA